MVAFEDEGSHGPYGACGGTLAGDGHSGEGRGPLERHGARERSSGGQWGGTSHRMAALIVYTTHGTPRRSSITHAGPPSAYPIRNHVNSGSGSTSPTSP